jgi:hypothetical protein
MAESCLSASTVRGTHKTLSAALAGRGITLTDVRKPAPPQVTGRGPRPGGTFASSATPDRAGVKRYSNDETSDTAAAGFNSDVPRVAGHKATADELKSLNDTLDTLQKESGARNGG